MPKENIKISLVIPAYNEEKYIGNCLKKIEASNNKFFEIIVVDNGSQDHTSDIAKSFPNVKVVIEPRKGVMFARQKGINISNGNILAFTDADTLISDGWTNKIIFEFSKDPKLALLSGPIFYYDSTMIEKTMIWMYWNFLAFPTYFITRHMSIFSNLVIRKDILEKMNGLDTTIVFYGDDTDTSLRASKFGKVKFSPSFKMSASARRLHNQGFFNTGFKYTLNHSSSVLIHKPVTQKYKDFR